MEPLRLGLDLATPHVVVAAIRQGRPVLLSRGDEALPEALACSDGMEGEAIPLDDASPNEPEPSDLHGWSWDTVAPDVLEDMAAVLLRAVRERFAPDVPCEAALCVPHCAGARGREALMRGAARAQISVLRCLRPTEAIALAEGARHLPGVTVTVSLDLGHLEVGVFEARDGSLHTRALRNAPVTLGDLFVEDVVSWVSFTLDQRHHAHVAASRGVRWRLADAVRHALASTAHDAPLTIATPFLGEGGGPEFVTATSDVLALAFDDVLERVAALTDDALRAAEVPLARVARAVIAGRQSRVAELGEGLSRRWGLSCAVLEPTAAAQGAALEFVHAADSSRHPPSTPASRIPPSAPPPLPAPTAHPPSSIPRPSSIPPVHHAPPVASSPSSHPSPLLAGEVASARLPREGRFAAAPAPRDMLAMPLVRAATADELSRPLALPALLAQIGMRPHLDGTLTLHGESEVVRMGVDHGAPVVHAGDRSKLLRCFLWREGAYEITEARLPGSSLATREPMTGLVVAGLRVLLRETDDARVAEALAPRIHMAPVLRPEREGRLHRMRLMPSEERVVTQGLDPATELAAHLRNASSMLRLALVLELMEIVSWAPPVKGAGEDPRAELSRRVTRMAAQNHFEALFAHWSVGGEEIAAAWRAFQAEYGPGGPWHAVDRELARAALERGAAAWAVLSTEVSRLRYRREAYPTIDPQLLVPLVEGRAKALAFAGQKAEAEDMLRLMRELQGATPDAKG